jgi:hypothetical protein
MMGEIMYRAEIMGEYPHDHESDELFYRWCLYYDRCETFDRTICTRRDERGDAVPVTPWERAESNRHARAVTDELKLRLSVGRREREQALELSDADRKQAIARYEERLKDPKTT